MPKKYDQFFKDARLPYVECRHTLYSDRHYKPHRHAMLSIGAIEEGVVSFSSDGEKSILHPETLIVINPEVVHSCNPIANQARSYFMLYLDTDWCQGLQSTIFQKSLSFVPVAQTLITDPPLYREYIALNNLLFDSQALILEKEEALEHFALQLFSRYCHARRVENLPSGKHEHFIKEAKAYMQSHLAQNVTVEEIAHTLKITSYHFIRLFKRHTGLSPHAYLLNLRIERAKKLLAGNLPIAQIALEVGFGDQSHLNRVFGRYVACTPYEYRKGLR
jgi:AraC-like DNA-binding protein